MIKYIITLLINIKYIIDRLIIISIYVLISSIYLMMIKYVSNILITFKSIINSLIVIFHGHIKMY